MTFVNQSKNSANFSNESKNTASFKNYLKRGVDITIDAIKDLTFQDSAVFLDGSETVGDITFESRAQPFTNQPKNT